MSARVWIRRAYDPATRNDGHRVLIDRLWPRGVAKADAQIDEWAKELAPSTELRRWFDHDPARWDEFRRRYRAELDGQPEAVGRLIGRTTRGRVTLVFGARDAAHSNAAALREILDERRDAPARPAVELT